MSQMFDVKLGDFRISYAFNSGVETRPMLDFHQHTTYELYYLCNGKRLYIINNKQYFIEKGDLVLIPRNVSHRTFPRTAPDYERLLVQIPNEYLKNITCTDFEPIKFFYANSPVISLPKKEQTIIESLLYNIITEGREKEENYKAAIQFHLAQILIRSNRYAQQTYIPKQDRNYKSDQAITQVILYINKYHTEFINLDMLADKFYISKAHLSRTFKKVTGQTIIQYLNFCRVRTAKNLLRKSNLSILEISARTGYNSVSHFGRIFKSITGTTPTEFRNLSLN